MTAPKDEVPWTTADFLELKRDMAAMNLAYEQAVQNYKQADQCAQEREAQILALLREREELMASLANVCRQYRSVRSAEGYPTEHSESILEAEEIIDRLRRGK